MSETPSHNRIDGDNPWPGLESFTEAAQSYFHGRDEEIAELQRRVKGQGLTILFGESGLGKTSLLQAGLFPKLRREAFLPVYVRLDFAADAPPLGLQVKHQLAEAIREAKLDLTHKLEDEPSAWQWLHLRNSECCDDFGRDVVPVLVFDQFEEVFTLGRGAAPALVDHFITELGDLTENRVPAELEASLEEDPSRAFRFDFRRSDFRVLLSLREDYLPHLEGLRSAIPSLMQNRMRLTRMNYQQALEAVLKPGGSLITPEVAVEIVGFVSGNKTDKLRLEVAPPLLSLVCRELNQRRQAKGEAQITGALLEGTRSEILNNFYERCMTGKPPAVRAFVEDELVTDSGNRESITLERARRALEQKEAPAKALEQLIDNRLLRLDERFGVVRVELTHDVLTGVVMASRRARREREEKEKLEAQRLEAEASAIAERRKFRRLLLGTSLMAAITVAALVLTVVTYRAKVAAYRAKQEAARERRNFYDAAIALLYQAWNDGNIGAARQRLEEARLANEGSGSSSAPSPWEWGYVKGLADLTDFGNVVSAPQNDNIDSIAFVPGSGGKQVVVGVGDGTLKEIDVRTGKEVRSFTWTEPTSIGFRFSKRKDGALLIVSVFPNTPASDDAHLREGDVIVGIGNPDGKMQDTANINVSQAAKLLHGPTGTKVVLKVQRQGSPKVQIIEVRRKDTLENFGHRGPVISLAFSKNGRRLLSGGTDARIIVWDGESAKGINELPFSNGVTGIEYSPDGNYLAVSLFDDKTVKLYKFGTQLNGLLDKTLSSDPVCGFDFSPDGRQIAIAAPYDKNAVEIGLFDLASEVPLRTVQIAGGSCRGLVFSSDGHRLATLVDGYIRIVDLSHPEQKPLFLPDQSSATSFAFSPDGNYVATTGADSLVTVWDVATGKSRLALRGHTAPAIAVAFSPDEGTLVTGGWDKTIRAWELRRSAPQSYRRVGTKHGTIMGVAFSPDGRLAVATSPFSAAPTVTLYDAAMWRELKQFPGKTNRLNFSPDGRLLAIPDEQGTIQIVDVATEKIVKKLERHTAQVNWVEFSPDGKLLASASDDKTALIWNLSSGASRPLTGHSSKVNAITFSPDGRFVATGSRDDRALRLFEVATGRMVWRSTARFEGYCLKFSPDGQLLLSGNIDGRLSLWRVREGKLALKGELIGHTSLVYDAAFSPDGLRLVTVAEDHTTRLWNVARMREMLVLDRNTPLEAAAFSPDGLLLVTAGDNNFYLWDAAVLAGHPSKPTPAFYLMRATNMWYLERWKSAAADFSRGLAMERQGDSTLAKQDRALILSYRGESEANLGDWKGAQADFAAALDLAPDNLQARYDHAIVSLHLDDQQEFDADRDYLVRQASTAPSSQNENEAAWVCSLLPATNASALDQITALDRQAAATNPKSYAYVSTFASLLCRDRRIDECLTALKASMALKPSDGRIDREPDGTPYDWVFMALAAVQQGHPDQAQRWLQYTKDHMARVFSDPLYEDPKYDWDWGDKLVMPWLEQEVDGDIHKFGQNRVVERR